MDEGAMPWATLMRLGIGVLRLAPSQFWQCTIRELAMALDATGQASTRNCPRRADLELLARRYPDNPKENRQ